MSIWPTSTGHHDKFTIKKIHEGKARGWVRKQQAHNITDTFNTILTESGIFIRLQEIFKLDYQDNNVMQRTEYAE